jgi:hypothetical protein
MMPALLTHTDCHVCGHRHHFCYLGDDLLTDPEYVYVCPETGDQGVLRPATAGEPVAHCPQGAVALTPRYPAGSTTPQAGPELLQEVLADVKATADKVGGLDRLADLVETLQQSKE